MPIGTSDTNIVSTARPSVTWSYKNLVNSFIFFIIKTGITEMPTNQIAIATDYVISYDARYGHNQ